MRSQGLQEALLAQIQTYAKDKAGAEIKYDAATYPYFMGADGKAYPNWTARLLKAAYNYQVSIKDPGAFAHGNKYIVQLLTTRLRISAVMSARLHPRRCGSLCWQYHAVPRLGC